jgi:AraC family transcriptional regulator of adaptative response/methylated-DNA-[protein]-cysteine methyltransferase
VASAKFESKTRSVWFDRYLYIGSLIANRKTVMENPAPNPNGIETASTIDDRWAAVKARDSAADGRFYYAVKTTGIYCKPSCGARTPLLVNVEFYDTAAAAEHAGFRACKRCKPDQRPLHEQHADTITQICRFIEQADALPSLAELAKRAGLSLYHFHRIFKSITGLTPKAYALAHRARRIRKELERGAMVTDAIYEAGYSSNSRFYAQSNRLLGMTPSRYRDGGVGTEIRFAIAECSLGSILVAASDKGICAIFIGNDPERLIQDLQDRFGHAELIGGDAEFEGLVAKVVGLVEAPSTSLDLPLDIRGTAFQQRVWQALCEIPIGTTATYTRLPNVSECPMR